MADTTILIVDDNPVNLELLEQELEEDYTVIQAEDGPSAITISEAEMPDLIMMDVMMPVMTGFEACRHLKTNPKTANIPVIFITALNSTDDIVEGFDAGGVDFITKPFQALEVLARVRTHLRIDELEQRVEMRTRELEETHAKLEATQADLIRELESELEKASQLQMGLMPTEAPKAAPLEICGRCIPANHVGGDFYQYYSTEGHLSVCLADVSGKAMDAAIPVVMFSGILNSQMEDEQPISERFQRLNRSLHRSLDERTFICFEMAEFNTVSRTVNYANAGCPYPYLYRAGSDTLQEIVSDNYPLGVCADQGYQSQSIEMASGDVLTFCSDGIVEETNTQSEQFGFDRTEGVVLEACGKGLSADRIADHILSSVSAFRGSGHQSDDMTCVVLRFAG